ncbi:MucR family transcriptional regulator [Sphingomonas qomolangmaensis]|uniref:MucR family transcriptional regulator n=1 Tax=Sphingomonas qomolangmaensis TaxID=2918765 RepID=A0ABY5LGJ1_9SPHN|nr:MucR family transcriptional regulator [Sphingomonas qomolangmaensis]UUL83836.1 MucR family transcriptional regulator [Sphingomonas qomolangmaensis]
MAEDVQLNAVDLATELTIAWLGNQNNRAAAEDVPAFLRTMHATVIELANGAPDANAEEPAEAAPTEYVPAVSVRKSLGSKDHILSMIDGKPYKTLRRHLNTHGMTPEEYRARYNLKADYPMVAETYSEARRAMAKKIGLGSKGRQARASAAQAPGDAAKPAPRKRTKAAG